MSQSGSERWWSCVLVRCRLRGLVSVVDIPDIMVVLRDLELLEDESMRRSTSELELEPSLSARSTPA